MRKSQARRRRSVLVSGASIAGLTLAYWLDRYGFGVTVLEHAPTIRTGGYPIDIRGTAMDVIERMGLRPDVEVAHIASRRLTFVDAAGETIGVIPVYDLAGNREGHDVELARGTLTTLLHGLTRDGVVRYLFEDSIEEMSECSAQVAVRFRSGRRERYDLVVGADGIHSNTRRLTFGPEAPFSQYLGYTFNLFSMPNELGLSHEGIVYAEPGRIAGSFAVRDAPNLFAFLIFATQTPPFGAHSNREAQIERTAAVFASGGWQVPRMVEAMRHAEDLYFDTVTQIRMPGWSKGRVAIVGDAAYAPSFRSGQGTSLALVGAYVLAGEMAAHADHLDAFASYERAIRPYVEANQALAIKQGDEILLPRTQAELDVRNRLLATLKLGHSSNALSQRARAAHAALTLPDYDTPAHVRDHRTSEPSA